MVTNEGLLGLLRYLLRSSAIQTKIGLFANNYTPVPATVQADLTEATFAGYARIDATSITWPDPAINGDDQGESDGPTITWTCTAAPGSPETIYGLFVLFTDESAAIRTLFAFRFASPTVITLSGDLVSKKLNWFDANLVP